MHEALRRKLKDFSSEGTKGCSKLHVAQSCNLRLDVGSCSIPRQGPTGPPLGGVVERVQRGQGGVGHSLSSVGQFSKQQGGKAGPFHLPYCCVDSFSDDCK